MSTRNSCIQCGVCCKIFYINLNKEEYLSAKYITIFDGENKIGNFDLAAECGANFLAKKEDDSCIYLKKNKCAIHEIRPQVCRDFFCDSNNLRFVEMKKVLSQYKKLI